MMFLKDANVIQISKKQYFFKLKAFTGVFSSLLSMQIIGFLFSLGGVGTMSSSSEGIHISMKYFSGDIMIVMTFIWAFIIGITITKREYRYSDFAFTGNRITSNLSNLFFLCTTSLVGGVSALLVGNLLKVIMYYYFGSQNCYGSSLLASPLELFLGIIVTIFYLLVFSVVGYFFGMLAQLNKVFIVLLPGIIIGSTILDARTNGNSSLMMWLANFYYHETSFLVFLLKVFITVGVFFYCAILLSNRMEVRK